MMTHSLRSWGAPRLAAITALLACLGVPLPAHAGMLMISGYYTADNVDDRQIAELGLTPDFVCVKNEVYEGAICRTSTMSTNSAKPLFNNSANISNAIQEFGNSYFEVGTSKYANYYTGEAYYFVAFEASDGEMAVGSYTGNGSDNRSITGVGFQPDLVIVMGEGSTWTVWSAEAHPSDITTSFGSTNSADDLIQDFESDGFEIGTKTHVNDSGTTFHYVAFKASANVLATTSYTGNGSDNRSITGIGFQPEWAVVKRYDSEEARQHMGALGANTDDSAPFINGDLDPNFIQSLESDGFEVGSQSAVNASGRTYYAFAFARASNPLAVNLSGLEASFEEPHVALRWHTDQEFNNLGFRVLRETRDGPIAMHDGLLAGLSAQFSHTEHLAAGQDYVWYDVDGGMRDRYWVVDVDVSGRETWHGPTDVTISDQATPRKSAYALQRQNNVQSARGSEQALEFPEHDTQPAESPVLTQASLYQQWDLTAQDAIKIGVENEGWVRISQAELLEAGLDPWADPQAFGLYVDGEAVPMLVEGENDGHFQSGDSIQFYGRASNSRWSRSRVYWLVPHADQPARIPLEYSSANAAVFPQNFLSQSTLQRRSFYFAALRNGEGDNFFGSIIANYPLNETLPSPGALAIADTDALLHLQIQGVTPGKHAVDIALNDQHVGTALFTGQETTEAYFDVPSDWLRDGPNTITIQSQQSGDVSLVDTLSLHYDRAFQAHDGRLTFTVPNASVVTLSGFEPTRVRVFDITDERAVTQISLEAGRDGGHGDQMRVHVPEGGAPVRRLLAIEEGAVAHPTWLESHDGEALTAERAGADMVIVTHPSLLDAAETLADHRRTQGLLVQVVDVHDIYDSYNYGTASPHAIRRFFQDARDQWEIAPRYALLLGDASIDPRGYLAGVQATQRIPFPPVDTAYMETASDLWYAQLDDDNLPDIALGRLPAADLNTALAMVEKLIAYDIDATFEERNGVLLLADDDPFGGFESATTGIADIVPNHLDTTIVVREDGAREVAETELQDALDEAPALVHYLGHGSVSLWQDGWLDNNRTTMWAEANPALVISMTCLTGFYHDAYSTSLAETLLARPDGGAAAVWASSGVEYPQDHTVFDHALVGALTSGKHRTIGDATLQAMRLSAQSNALDTWHLLGDPATPITIAAASEALVGPTHDTIHAAASLDIGKGEHHLGGCQNVRAANLCLLTVLALMQLLWHHRHRRPSTQLLCPERQAR